MGDTAGSSPHNQTTVQGGSRQELAFGGPMVQSQYHGASEFGYIQRLAQERDRLLERKRELLSQRQRLHTLNESLLSKVLTASRGRKLALILGTGESSQFNFTKQTAFRPQLAA